MHHQHRRRPGEYTSELPIRKSPIPAGTQGRDKSSVEVSHGSEQGWSHCKTGLEDKSCDPKVTWGRVLNNLAIVLCSRIIFKQLSPFLLHRHDQYQASCFRHAWNGLIWLLQDRSGSLCDGWSWLPWFQLAWRLRSSIFTSRFSNGSARLPLFPPLHLARKSPTISRIAGAKWSNVTWLTY